MSIEQTIEMVQAILIYGWAIPASVTGVLILVTDWFVNRTRWSWYSSSDWLEMVTQAVAYPYGMAGLFSFWRDQISWWWDMRK